MLRDSTPKKLFKSLFPVVGIGASAGGLLAFKKMVAAIPADSGMAYIFVQHLHPSHESLLPEILQKLANIPVVEISNNVQIEINHIYVIPPNKVLVATEGVLKLSPRPVTNKFHLPIDIFFSSLAEVYHSHSIGVILSGTGTDGSIGLKSIKDHGGITIVQDVTSSEYDSMPQHAIEAETVDFILSPENIPEKLMELQQSFSVNSPEEKTHSKNKKIEEGFMQILSLLRERTGVDFFLYKQTTVRRRIIRRMIYLKLNNVFDYHVYLKKYKLELDNLFNDLLIQVTSFFRDPASFITLNEIIFPEMVKNLITGQKDKPGSNPLRIWVAGCSTGQEAYSIAISILEYLSDHISNFKVQIFASDLSERSIKIARNGIYSKKELIGVSDRRLEQFFIKTDGQYQLKKSVRDICVFAVHNFLKDPPFAKIDLITCRNVLIYFEPILQKKALTTFHYALKEKAILMLGKSETTGNSSEIFFPFGKKDKFFIRKSVPGRFMNVASSLSETLMGSRNYFQQVKERKPDDFQKSADHILLSKYTPVGVVVNDQYDIVQFRGHTGKFLEPLPGKASLNVLKMAKEGLAFEIRNGLNKAKKNNISFSKDGIALGISKELISIEVIPLPGTIESHYLILFRENSLIIKDPVPLRKGKGNSETNTMDQKDYRIQQLETELLQLREDMHGIAEEQEAAIEELQSANEELLSGSEELQSLNEELETSKEELQSTNEELNTVNLELYERNEELGQSRKFANAIVSILHEPLLVLDNNYHIKSANNSFYKSFGITEEVTIGKKLFELQHGAWNNLSLQKELREIQKLNEKMIEVEISFVFPEFGERTICFNMQTITRENGEQLIVLACNDITAQKNSEQIIIDKSAEFKNVAGKVSKERQLYHNLLEQLPALLCVLKGPEHIFEFANPLFYQLLGKDKLTGQKFFDALPELKEQGFLEILNKVLKTGKTFMEKEMPLSIAGKKGKPKIHLLNINFQVYKNAKGGKEGILIFGYDQTKQALALK